LVVDPLGNRLKPPPLYDGAGQRPVALMPGTKLEVNALLA
jgi:hypothetical protein